MSRCECSVILIQYNPIFEKVKMTLNSILSQANCSYEIIIADDGSEKNCFDEIEKYFDEKNYLNFHLVDNKKNAGTVKNVISGVQVSSGKYVRVIAPGDMLYSSSTLRNIVDFMDKNQAKEMFGKMAFYQEKNGEVSIIKQQIPFDFRPYKKHQTSKIKRNLLVLGDNISGASYTWEREYYLECLMRICDKVKYMEDCINAYTIYDGHDIFFMDEFVTWYEYGTGISTNKNTKWTKLLIADWVAFLQDMQKRYSNNLYIKVALCYYRMSQKKDVYNKIIKNILFFYRFIYGRFRAKSLSETDYESVNKEYISKYI